LNPAEQGAPIGGVGFRNRGIDHAHTVAQMARPIVVDDCTVRIDEPDQILAFHVLGEPPTQMIRHLGKPQRTATLLDQRLTDNPTPGWQIEQPNWFGAGLDLESLFS